MQGDTSSLRHTFSDSTTAKLAVSKCYCKRQDRIIPCKLQAAAAMYWQPKQSQEGFGAPLSFFTQ